jgi:hypothetical protein
LYLCERVYTSWFPLISVFIPREKKTNHSDAKPAISVDVPCIIIEKMLFTGINNIHEIFFFLVNTPSMYILVPVIFYFFYFLLLLLLVLIFFSYVPRNTLSVTFNTSKRKWCVPMVFLSVHFSKLLSLRYPSSYNRVLKINCLVVVAKKKRIKGDSCSCCGTEM